MTSAGQDRQLPTSARRHGGGQGANLQLRTIPAADAKASWNPADQPARLLEIISPAGFERYFADLADILSGPGSPIPGSWRHLPAATVSTSTPPPYPGWPTPTG
jgi:hypothetical protein